MILPQKQPNLIDTTVFVNSKHRTTNYVSRSRGGALNFGYVAPGGNSSTVIARLNFSGGSAINNIRFGIVTKSIIPISSFNYDVLNYIDYSYVPSKKFLGFNENFNNNSNLNISVGKLNNLSSNYVYLNVQLPENMFLYYGTIRYVWFFNHDGAIT